MVYIVFVNPQILGNAGMDKGAVFVATCIAAAVSTLVMALYANYPIALAPGMGLNAFFAFTVVITYKYTWQQALAAVFCSGFLFLLISVFRLREYVINAIPLNLKLAISAGVGLFLGIIALEQARIVVAHPVTLVTRGDLRPGESVITRSGVWIGRHWLRVSRDATAHEGVLEREQELARLHPEIESAEAQVQRQDIELTRLREGLIALERERDELQTQLNRRHQEYSELQAELGTQRGRADEANLHAERLTAEARALVAPMRSHR